jgi:hypothetical protein
MTVEKKKLSNNLGAGLPKLYFLSDDAQFDYEATEKVHESIGNLIEFARRYNV